MMMGVVNEYTDGQGRSPYAFWLRSLRDARAKARIILRVDKMELGLLGDVQPIGDGLSELRIHYGPGYRVYFATPTPQSYLLLCGGDKPTQSRDIVKAKIYWKDYKRKSTWLVM